MIMVKQVLIICFSLQAAWASRNLAVSARKVLLPLDGNNQALRKTFRCPRAFEREEWPTALLNPRP